MCAGAPCAARLHGLRGRLRRSGLDALLITHPPNVRYLSGFTGSAGWLLVRTAAAVLLTDSRYAEQATHEVRAAGGFVGRVGFRRR